MDYIVYEHENPSNYGYFYTLESAMKCIQDMLSVEKNRNRDYRIALASESLLRFNNETENLQILSEECNEVSQIVSKIARFGFDSCWEGHSNIDRLHSEIGDLQAMIDILVARGTLDRNKLREEAASKIKRLGDWYNYEPFEEVGFYEK